MDELADGMMEEPWNGPPEESDTAPAPSDPNREPPRRQPYARGGRAGSPAEAGTRVPVEVGSPGLPAIARSQRNEAEEAWPIQEGVFRKKNAQGPE